MGGGVPRFGNNHPTYLWLGHYSAGQAKRSSQGFIQSSFFNEKILLILTRVKITSGNPLPVLIKRMRTIVGADLLILPLLVTGTKANIVPIKAKGLHIEPCDWESSTPLPSTSRRG